LVKSKFDKPPTLSYQQLTNVSRGAQAIGIHPKYLYATLDQADFQRYKMKVEARQKKAYRYFHNGMINNTLFVAKTSSPYADNLMQKVFLNPDQRVQADKKTGELTYSPALPKKAVSKDAEQTKIMLESLAKASAADSSKVGVDVEDINAINIENQTFVKRNFTASEQAYCRKAPSPQASFAGRWSAKEAVFKALGVSGKGAGAGLAEIEVLNDETGAPQVTLHGDALKAAKQAVVKSVNVSISHSDTQAIAVAISAF
jgi:fatty acid synthase subunit alpha, fungi type